MVKGHMENGKFHPHTQYKKGVRKSRDQSAKTEGVRLKKDYETRTYKVWTFKKASPELKEKILENYRNNYSGQDNWYAEDDGILYLNIKDKDDIVGYEIFKGNMPKYWDLDRGAFIQFELEIKDDEKFRKAFGITKDLWNKVDFRFVNERENNTRMEIIEESTYDKIDLDEPYEQLQKYQSDEVPSSERISRKEFEDLQKANALFEELVDTSLSNLKRNYEWEFSDEYIIDAIEANDYRFTEDGKIG